MRSLPGTVLLAMFASGPAWTDERKAPEVASESPKPNLPDSLVATRSALQPLNLLLSQSELVAVVRNYEVRTGEVLTAPISDDEILVTAPGYQAPMRDSSQAVMGGIAAPFWALAHPRDAWRIFVPIPPKGRSQESERPAPDPR
jgi:hypothetical protein